MPNRYLPTDAKDKARRMIADGHRLNDIAKETGVSLRTIQRYVDSVTRHEHKWQIAGFLPETPAVVQSCECGMARTVEAPRHIASYGDKP